MSDSIAALAPLGPEYFEAYYEVVSRTLARAQTTFTKAALGSEVLEMLNRQLGAMSTLKAGYDLNFDVRREAWEFQGCLMHNFGILEKRNIAYEEQIKATFDRFNQLLKDEHYLPWLTDAGRSVVMKPLLVGASLKRELACIPLRSYAMRGAIITAGEAVKGASPDTFKYALKSLVEAFLNYYLDGVYLRKQLAPEFEKHVLAMFEMYESIDARIAAIKSKAEQEAAARNRSEDDDGYLPVNGQHVPDTYAPRADEDDESASVRHTPADTYVPLNDDYWGSSYNPANGLPMVSGSGWDVMGNAYGTDFNHFD